MGEIVTAPPCAVYFKGFEGDQFGGDMDLFHYCSNQNFLSILEGNEIFASDLTLSNDALEGKWIKQVFSNICREDSALSQHHEKLTRNFDFLTDLAGAMGFCLSEDGDLLSQWRGYADNGAGVSIGFDDAYLEQLYDEEIGGSLQKVIYDQADQKKGLEKLIVELKKQIDLGAFKSASGSILSPTTEDEKQKILKASNALWLSYLLALPILYTFKNPAFQEEKEWRLIYYLVNQKGEWTKESLADLSFRGKHDRIVPTRRVKFVDKNAPIIKKVILGPRNITPEKLVSAALARFGFVGVEVFRSESSYR